MIWGSYIGFRTVEISRACEIHIKEGQLEISSDEGTVLIPIEDLNQIMVHGANIRLSTMDLSILSQNKVSVMTLDEKYLPTAIVLPYEGHARQSKLMHMQEALAAKEYFSYYHEGLNRRSDDPINSRLNYGYAIVRSSIARSLVAAGFHPTFGIHHDSQLNAFNLADDLIEPYRAIVDVVARENIGSNVKLSKSERRAMAYVLHNACMMDGMKINVMSAINMMVESLKRIILDKSKEKLQLPLILPIESMKGITE